MVLVKVVIRMPLLRCKFKLYNHLEILAYAFPRFLK